MIYLVLFITSIYVVLITAFLIGFYKTPSFRNTNTSSKNTFSIVIPFRNEATNLPVLLNSLASIKYDKCCYEIILVNDNSSDNYRSIIKNFGEENPTIQLTLINSKRNTNSPKKDAINTAIETAKFEWILTTDADCEVPFTWLQLFNQFIEEKEPLFISAPVKFKEQSSLLFHFQNLNFISLIGSTIGGFGISKPFLCNGANLCYNKAAFIKVKGFEGNFEIASGDDVFLLEKMKIAYPTKIYFLKSKDSIVLTTAENSFNSFLNQQIRWASKATAYKSNFTKFVGLLVLTINLLLVLLFFSAIFNPYLWKLFLVIFIQKLTIDFLLILKTSIFLNSTKSLKYSVFTSILYPFFTVITGFLSLYKSYNWKGRDFIK
tara:strand:- start:25137 stop:26264 length:1128 start_codon:yes stop_codon:yes gene_type:complete